MENHSSDQRTHPLDKPVSEKISILEVEIAQRSGGQAFLEQHPRGSFDSPEECFRALIEFVKYAAPVEAGTAAGEREQRHEQPSDPPPEQRHERKRPTTVEQLKAFHRYRP